MNPTQQDVHRLREPLGRAALDYLANRMNTHRRAIRTLLTDFQQIKTEHPCTAEPDPHS